MKLYIILLICIINISTFNFGKVVNYNEYYNSNHDNNNEEQPIIKKKTVASSHPSSRSIEGKLCDSGNHECSLEFKELGPFTYKGYEECYIIDPSSGPDDKNYVKIPGSERIYIDINANLKCIVNGKVYEEVQRVNINGYDNRLPQLTSFPSGMTLSKGTNTIHNNTYLYFITLSDCTNVWSYRDDISVNCECEKIEE